MRIPIVQLTTRMQLNTHPGTRIGQVAAAW